MNLFDVESDAIVSTSKLCNLVFGFSKRMFEEADAETAVLKGVASTTMLSCSRKQSHVCIQFDAGMALFVAFPALCLLGNILSRI